MPDNTSNVVSAAVTAPKLPEGVVDLASIATAGPADGCEVFLHFNGPTDQLSGLCAGMAVLDPGATPHPPHRHPEEEFLIIASGDGEISVAGKTTQVGPGAIMYVAGNTEHGIRNTGAVPMTFYFSKWLAKLLCAVLAVAFAGVAGRAQAPAPINAMIVTGGCCHDYTGQSKALMDTLNAVMPINWTVVHGMTALPDGRLPLFENSNWARGFDIVIHNECWANGDLPAQFVQNITNAAVPRMFFHCALHSYRVMKNDAWRELIGITSRRHTPSHNIMLKWADNDPITAGLPPFVTPIDELYVVEKVWPGTKAIATAVNGVDNGLQGPNEIYPVVWTHEYGGRARVFGTSLGHANETWTTNQFKELVTRGFRWALKKEPIAIQRAAPARRGGGPAPGAAAAPEAR